jgi:hypothetical protein
MSPIEQRLIDKQNFIEIQPNKQYCELCTFGVLFYTQSFNQRARRVGGGAVGDRADRA